MNINEIDVTKYGSYAIADTNKDFKIYKKTPSGEVEYTDYDLFQIDDKQLIAFNTFDYRNTDHCYSILSNDNLYKKTINFYDYEAFKPILNSIYNFEKNLYWIMDSVSLLNPEQDLMVSLDHRCDTHSYGPIGFYSLSDGSNNPVIDISILSKLSGVGFCCMSSLGNLHIVKVTSNDYELSDRTFKDFPGATAGARTLTGALRLVLEWSAATEEPWNSIEDIAIKSKNFIDDLGIPQEVIDEIFEYQIPMPVSMYLSGDADPRRSINENTEVPPLFKNWFISSLRSKSLNYLVKVYPEILSIPNSVLQKELSFYESIIYSLFLANGITDNALMSLESAADLLADSTSRVLIPRTSIIVDILKEL